jgi:four helix bundle protein
MKKRESVVGDKSIQFAIKIVRPSQYLQTKQQELVLSKQVQWSGTAIGTLIHESEFAESKADFASKLSIVLKEANEISYITQV